MNQSVILATYYVVLLSEGLKHHEMKISIFFSIAVFLSFNSFSQLAINQTGTITQWVQNVLIGPGITVSNVTYTGDPLSIGKFTTGTIPTNLGFSAGIVMSSGKATDAPGPNSSGSQTYNSTGGSDPNLASSINTQPSNIKDASILQFDFIPVSDTVKFRYVFGSEEYDEFVGSSFNDVFGFFVSGINPYGGFYVNKNIALIPNTTTPVSINNVNNGSSNSGPCANCGYYTNNNGGQGVQYDGKTVVLTAWILVIPCFTYHIKLAIADVGDEAYDSGVFLEANSFMSNAVIIDQSTSNTIDTSAIEGCNDAIITFRIPAPIATPTIINYLPTGTATNGVDYTLIPNQIIIPAGLDSVNLIIHPILDGVVEPYEFVKLIVNTSSCTYDTVDFYIKDNQLTCAKLPSDTVLCDSTILSIPAQGTGGYSPYSYIWSTGDTTQSITVMPLITTNYTVTITDLCANDSIASMLVLVSKPDFFIFNDTVCKGSLAQLEIIQNNPLTYLWATSATTPSIFVSPTQTTSYQVRITDSLGCFVDTAALAVINPLPIITVSSDVSICKGDSTILSASGGYFYQWSSGDIGSVVTTTPLATFTNTVTVTNSYNCFDEASILIEVMPVPDAAITTSIDTLCKGSVAILTASGGDSYLWNTGLTVPSIEIIPQESSQYSVVASFSNASIICYDTARFTQNVKRCNRFYVPSAFTPDGDGLNDFFGVEGVFTNIENFQFIVFDRWGKQVYFSKDVHNPWDGRIDNAEPIGGVYTYKIIIQETFSEQYVLSGNVTLIR